MPAAAFERLVREAMQREDLTLYALARASGIERNSWYAWFRGDYRPQPRTLARAAPFLNLTVDELSAPWGALRPEATVTDASGLINLTAAINRLAAVLEGRLEGLEPELEEGIARGRSRAAAGRSSPGPSPQRSSPAKQAG